ncbi:MAG: hypothetical protein ABR613_13600 [Actinomycetota bacterium]
MIVAVEMARRLGIKEGDAIAVVNEPPDFWEVMRPLPRDVEVFERATRPLDVIVYFSDEVKSIERRVPAFAEMIVQGGSLWVGHLRDRVATAYVDRTGARAGLATAELLDAGGGWMLRRLTKR